MVRWENRQELFIDPSGNETLSKAVVYLDQEVDLGGYLYLGTLDDFSSSEPTPRDSDAINAKEIRSVRKSFNIKGGSFLFKAWL